MAHLLQADNTTASATKAITHSDLANGQKGEGGRQLGTNFIWEQMKKVDQGSDHYQEGSDVFWRSCHELGKRCWQLWLIHAGETGAKSSLKTQLGQLNGLRMMQ